LAIIYSIVIVDYGALVIVSHNSNYPELGANDECSRLVVFLPPPLFFGISIRYESFIRQPDLAITLTSSCGWHVDDRSPRLALLQT